MKKYDVAVLGLGTMGSMTALELARRGASVVGFDRFDPPHSYGSHSGETRTFRKGYSENSQYVPLTQLASRLWDDLGEELGMQLLTRSGLMMMGPSSSKKIIGIQHCQETFRLDIDTLSAAEIRYRYPAFNVPDDFIGLLERGAGWIDVDNTLNLTRGRATKLGADIHLNDEVVSWNASGSEVEVKTSRTKILAKSLVITAGPWVQSALGSIGVPLHLRRKVLFWFDPLIPDQFREGSIPIYGFPPNSFYGFPNIRNRGVKISEHWGGEDLEDPDNVRCPDERDSESLLRTVSEYMPGLAGPSPGESRRIIRSATCLYTMTSDGDFVLDIHPDFHNVFFASGFSGHGFKFAPVIGMVMTDLALNSTTEIPIDFLRLGNRPKVLSITHKLRSDLKT